MRATRAQDWRREEVADSAHTLPALRAVGGVRMKGSKKALASMLAAQGHAATAPRSVVSSWSLRSPKFLRIWSFSAAEKEGRYLASNSLARYTSLDWTSDKTRLRAVRTRKCNGEG